MAKRRSSKKKVWKPKKEATPTSAPSEPNSPMLKSLKTSHDSDEAKNADSNADTYNPFGRDAPTAFRRAVDAIHGFPFGGSVAFVGTKNNVEELNETVVKLAGDGQAEIRRQIHENVVVTVRSAGFLDGDYAEILINEVDYSPNKKGLNLVVIDPLTLDAYLGVFDTHSHIGNESPLLARFLQSVPDGHIILLAVRYDASRRLHPDARQALVDSGVNVPAPDNADALSDVIGELDASRAGDLLQMCATLNARKCGEVLLKSGWDVNHTKPHGSRNAALHDAVFHGSLAMVELLLENGADVAMINKWNETAQDIANKLFGFSSLEEMIQVHHDKSNELLSA